MTPNFPQTNLALFHTLSYFKIDRISDQIKYFSGEPNFNWLDSFHEVALQYHKHMENEINQNLIGSIHFIQQSLFEYLRDWLSNWQFNSDISYQIQQLIYQENLLRNNKFKEDIKRDEEEFKKSIPEGVKEGEEYEIKFDSYYNVMLKKMIPERVEIKVNKFTTDKVPDLINEKYIPKYVDFVSGILQSFKSHSEKYVNNFFNGNYKIYNQPASDGTQKRELIEPIIQTPSKIKSLIPVKHLMYLFKALIDEKVIENPSEIKVLHEMIANSFYTNKSDELSVDQMQKKWSEIKEDPKIAAFWVGKFIELHNQARKDNPNNIKT